MIVWVQFPALKIHFYHKEVLTTLGNLIGRTIKLDYHTLNQQRAKFARLAVEVDLSKHLVPRIWLDDAWQKVEYENLPTVCFHCGRIGHTEEECPEKRLALPPPASTKQGVVTPATGAEEISEEPNPGFGPWLLVTRKGGRNQRDGDRKGRAERDVVPTSSGGQSGSGKSLSKGRGVSPIGDKGISSPSSQTPRIVGQERKDNNGNKKGDEGKKGKAKAQAEGTTGGKGLLGSGPTRSSFQTIGPKAPRTSSDQASTSSHPADEDMTRSTPPGPMKIAKQDGPQAQAIKLPPPPPTQTIIGPNGTEMQIVSFPSSDGPPQASPSARTRTKKGKSKKSTPIRSPSKLFPTKALQVWTPKKDRKLKSKARMASLTLQEIDAWTKAAQLSTRKVGEATAVNCQEEAELGAASEAVTASQTD
ncbi:unnamed protein product [Linum trigynum]|uniref:CCHC-type domain-containing protein n=1 Tax=Linum trigynum TaxID=586398 RepID=A0AAV2F2E4_9ROSI